MKINTFSSQKPLDIITAVLLCTAGAIIALLIIGTIFALVRQPNSAPVFTLGTEQRTANSGTLQEQADDIRVFSGLGRLRIPLANSSILLLSIAFPYSANDAAFAEELAVKINDLKAIAADYFSSLPSSSIIQIDEDAAKQEILRRFNNSLRLGRITALYFSDMQIFD